MAEVGNEKEHNYKISVEWCDVIGEYEYVLRDMDILENNLGVLEARNSGGSRLIPFMPSSIATGDREWAERIAKHYGIDVPDEPSA